MAVSNKSREGCKEDNMAESEKITPVELEIDGKKRVFDIDNPVLPAWIDDCALASGGYPYKKKLVEDEYAKTLEELQEELVKCSSGSRRPASA
jgi:polyphosphate kinase 2 (PPK2 family)